MRTYLDCIPCMMQQALRAGRIATSDEHAIKRLLGAVGAMVNNIPMDVTPPETGEQVYRMVREMTGVSDPYRLIKESSISEAQSLYPGLKRMVSRSDDRLLTAIRIAIAGNVIDFGVNASFNLAEDVRVILSQEFAILDYDAFVSHLHDAETILYLGDNAGESVLDKLLIEELNKDVTYVVRELPVINDVTREDAISSGLDEVAEIVSSGSEAPGTILDRCTEEFRDRFARADMVISKGQGNYEGLSESDRPVFFLLKAKCPLIARDLNVREHDIVLKGVNV